jgi:hypothetical protein
MENYYFLVNNADDFPASIEAGKVKGGHYAHRGEFNKHPAPCNHDYIPSLCGVDVAIFGLDANTFIGILRFEGATLPALDYALMERVDLDESTIVEDASCDTLMYIAGIKQLAKDNGFPDSTDTPIDVTTLIEKIMLYSIEEVIEAGRKVKELDKDS